MRDFFRQFLCSFNSCSRQFQSCLVRCSAIFNSFAFQLFNAFRTGIRLFDFRFGFVSPFNHIVKIGTPSPRKLGQRIDPLIYRIQISRRRQIIILVSRKLIYNVSDFSRNRLEPRRKLFRFLFRDVFQRQNCFVDKIDDASLFRRVLAAVLRRIER